MVPLRRHALSVLFTSRSTSCQTTCTVSERSSKKALANANLHGVALSHYDNYRANYWAHRGSARFSNPYTNTTNWKSPILPSSEPKSANSDPFDSKVLSTKQTWCQESAARVDHRLAEYSNWLANYIARIIALLSLILIYSVSSVQTRVLINMSKSLFEKLVVVFLSRGFNFADSIWDLISLVRWCRPHTKRNFGSLHQNFRLIFSR